MSVDIAAWLFSCSINHDPKFALLCHLTQIGPNSKILIFLTSMDCFPGTFDAKTCGLSKKEGIYSKGGLAVSYFGWT